MKPVVNQNVEKLLWGKSIIYNVKTKNVFIEVFIKVRLHQKKIFEIA
jgi:hypothetical protein